jgi:hypothetical protein
MKGLVVVKELSGWRMKARVRKARRRTGSGGTQARTFSWGEVLAGAGEIEIV